MRTASVLAQAKLNLFLRVVAREASGYHQLETLFTRIALGDEVTVRAVAHGRSLDCTGPAMPTGGLGAMEKNLAFRAAAEFAEAVGWPGGFAIEITKHIPVGGGLGGGSADAGAVLRALNAIAPRAMQPSRLLSVGANLGSDVPFLTQDLSPLALAWGRGERLMTLSPLPSRPCVLFAFPFGVSTKDAYTWLTASPAAPTNPVTYTVADLAKWPVVLGQAFNEFERVVLPRVDPVAQTLAILRGPLGAEAMDCSLMSGSGATIFSLPRQGAPQGRPRLLEALAGLGESGPRVLETFIASHVESVRLAD